jgi:hypothetical protein
LAAVLEKNAEAKLRLCRLGNADGSRECAPDDRLRIVRRDPGHNPGSEVM